MVPWIGLQCVIVVFPDHTRLLFLVILEKYGSTVVYIKLSSFHAKMPFTHYYSCR